MLQNALQIVGSFSEHHRMGEKIARKILRRFHFETDEIDTICNIISNQIRFQSMMTDRGMQKFLELPDKERLIELARAQNKSKWWQLYEL